MKFGLLGREVFGRRIIRFEEMRWYQFVEFTTGGMLSCNNIVRKESKREGDGVRVTGREERGISDQIRNLFESGRPIGSIGGD